MRNKRINVLKLIQQTMSETEGGKNTTNCG